MDFTVDERREQAKSRLAEENPLIVLGAPPCTVFSSMQQQINAKHNIGEAFLTWLSGKSGRYCFSVLFGVKKEETNTEITPPQKCVKFTRFQVHFGGQFLL